MASESAVNEVCGFLTVLGVRVERFEDDEKRSHRWLQLMYGFRLIEVDPVMRRPRTRCFKYDLRLQAVLCGYWSLRSACFQAPHWILGNARVGKYEIEEDWVLRFQLASEPLKPTDLRI